MTQEQQLTTEQLIELKKNADSARASKIQSASEKAAARRLYHEATTIPDAEARTGTTLGIDLGVVWLKSGECTLVRKPPTVKFEKYQLKQLKNAVGMEDVDELLSPPTLVYPASLESLSEDAAEVKFAAALIATRLAEVDQKSLEGKS